MTQLLGGLYIMAMFMCVGNAVDMLVRQWRRRRHGL